MSYQPLLTLDEEVMLLKNVIADDDANSKHLLNIHYQHKMSTYDEDQEDKITNV
jgi:hypothetical protein